MCNCILIWITATGSDVAVGCVWCSQKASSEDSGEFVRAREPEQDEAPEQAESAQNALAAAMSLISGKANPTPFSELSMETTVCSSIRSEPDAVSFHVYGY